MATSLKNLSHYDPNKVPEADEMTFGIIVSEYNPDITLSLRDGCLQTLVDHGAKEQNIQVYYVPGGFELPSGAQHFAAKHEIDAVICLGCVIKGDTRHDEYINQAIANGIQRVAHDYQKPVIFGVLTTDNLQQAQDRAGGEHGNKGVEAAIAAIKMTALLKS